MNLRQKFQELNRNKDQFYIHYKDSDCQIKLANRVKELMKEKQAGQPVVVVCIGTDRSTGDSLGPLVGQSLSRFTSKFYTVYGTLKKPVHAVNLDDTLEYIEKVHPDAYIIAVDACLGRYNSIGNLSVSSGPVKPGAGVHKQLKEVGDIHLTGVVNISGYMETFVLQNTRLSLVMDMAEILADSLHQALVREQMQVKTNTVVPLHEE